MLTIEDLLKMNSNRQRIKAVKDNKKNIIPFVGAGISCSCGLEDWKGLLDSVASQYMSPDDLAKYSSDDADLIEYAEYIAIRSGTKNSYRKRVIELSQFEKDEISILPELIVKHFSGQIITTNYDEILEYAARTNLKRMKSILPSSKSGIHDALAKGEKFIYHLHGSVEENDSIILTKSSYETLYGIDSGHFTTTFEGLCSLYANKMFLFLGCSLKKDYILDVFRTSVKRIPEACHYAILELPEKEEQYEFNKALDKCGILPIYYPKGQYECVATILQYIAGCTPKKNKAKDTTSEDTITEELSESVKNGRKAGIDKDINSNKQTNANTKNKPEIIGTSQMPSKTEFDEKDELFELENKYIDETVKKSLGDENKLLNLEKAMSLLLREKDEEGSLKSLRFKESLERLLDSKNTCALAVSGLQGTGKSTFLSLMFYRLYQKKDQNNIYPIIIDLHYWAKQDSSLDIKSGLTSDLNKIKKFIKKESYAKYVFFIDGADDTISKASELYSTVNNFIGQLKDGQFAFCLSQAEKIPENLKSNSIEISQYFNKAEYSIEMHSLIKDRANEIDKLVNYLANVYGIIRKDAVETLKRIVLDNTIEMIDYRTILMILRVFGEDNRSKLSLGECFYIYYNAELGGKKTFLDVAKSIYDYCIDSNVEIPTSSIHPEILYKNAITRDFFLAVFFINLFLPGYSKSVKQKCKNNGIVFTAQVNRFIKDLMETEYKDKTDEIVGTMTKDWDNCSVFMKSQIAYVLGRIKDNRFTLNFLKREWKKLDKELFSSNVSKKEAEDTQNHKMFLYRTISVSLIKFDAIQNERKTFLFHVLKDERLSQINRGFHLAYYGDKAYINGRDIPYYDKLDSGIEKTMKHLYGNVKRALEGENKESKFFYLDIITLYSLYQYRYEDKGVQDNYKKNLLLLIDELLDSSILKSDDLIDFLKMMKRCFNEYGKSAFASIIREFYQVKDKKRTGWVDRKVTDSESVADHMYSSYILALLTLPDSIKTCIDYSIDDVEEYKGYSKQEIKNMLLIHDIAESVTGDIPSPRKTEEQIEEERSIVNIFSFMDSFPQIYGLEEVRILWGKFDKKTDINSKLANEIDKIDALIQAFIYSERKNGNVSMEEWIKYTKSKVKTSLGTEILNRVLQAFEGNTYS